MANVPISNMLKCDIHTRSKSLQKQNQNNKRSLLQSVKMISFDVGKWYFIPPPQDRIGLLTKLEIMFLISITTTSTSGISITSHI